jgi:hypothetical protein
VTVELPDAPEMLDGLKLAVTPEGRSNAESATAVLKLLNGVAVTVAVVEEPAAAVAL